MALTGYTRSGYCIDRSDDSGSHHICLDLSSLGGSSGNYNNNNNYSNNQNQNFCTVTGQSDWCSSEDMPCHEDSSSACPVTNWCVCQWAFASYIEKSGGCDNIQNLVCESINLEAVLAYEKLAYSWSATDRNKYGNALSCLAQKCGFEQRNVVFAYSRYHVKSRWVGAFVVLGGIALGSILYRKRDQLFKRTIDLDQENFESKTSDSSKLSLNTKNIVC